MAYVDVVRSKLRIPWRVGIVTFYLFLFTSFSKSFLIALFATYSVDVNFRDY